MVLRSSTLIGGVLCFALGVVDALLTHKLGAACDIPLIVAGLGSLGVHPNLP